MPSPDLIRTVGPVAVLVVPIVIVKLASGLMQPSGAAAALVQPQINAVNEAAIDMPQWTPAQLAAGQHLLALRAQPFGPSPLLVNSTPAPVDATGETPTAETRPDQPEFALQAILNSAVGEKAVINGRLYAVGETIGLSSWRLVAADSDAREAVLIDGETGNSMTITVISRER